MTRGTTKEHFIRATLESLAYQTADVVKTMNKDSGTDIKLLRVDGGASKNDLLLQFQADILQTPVERAPYLETTALGVAYLAGLAVGYWKDIDDIKKFASEGQRYEPVMDKEITDDLYEGWQEAVQATMQYKHQSKEK